MKRVFIIVLTLLIASATCYRNKYHLRNRKSQIMFSSEDTNRNPNETPLLMDNIFEAKPVGISARMAGENEEKRAQRYEAPQENVRFKESNIVHNNAGINLNNLENPVIVKSVGNNGGFNPFNVEQRLAQMTPQMVTNRQAYDIVYKSHEDYYKDRQIRVFDSNFDKMEQYLVNNFREALNKTIDFNANKDLVDVRDLDRSSLNTHKWNVHENLPRVDRAAIQPSPKYEDQSYSNAREYTTDPYTATVGRFK